MPNAPQDEERRKLGIRRPPKSDESKDSPLEQEWLREQTKTETEQRPYLETEGGE